MAATQELVQKIVGQLKWIYVPSVTLYYFILEIVSILNQIVLSVFGGVHTPLVQERAVQTQS